MLLCQCHIILFYFHYFLRTFLPPPFFSHLIDRSGVSFVLQLHRKKKFFFFFTSTSYSINYHLPSPTSFFFIVFFSSFDLFIVFNSSLLCVLPKENQYILSTAMEPSPVSDQAPVHQGLYAKANIRQSKSISLSRPYISSRTRQRALSTANTTGPPTSLAPSLNLPSLGTDPEPVNSDPLSPQPASTTSKPRKRLSLGFALPVLPNGVTTTPRRNTSYTNSNNPSATSTPIAAGGASNSGAGTPSSIAPAYHHSATPSTSSISSIHTPSSISGPPASHHAKTQSFSHALTSPRSHHRQASSATSPSSSPKHRQSASVSYTRAHLKNMSTDSNASYGSDGSNYEAPDTVEFYFSQLAFKERRVVELKDEIQRLQMLLKQAESEFQYYYDRAEQKLRTVIPNNPITEEPGKPAVAAAAQTASTAENTAQAKSRRLSRIHSPFTFIDNVTEPRRHKQSASSISSTATSRHSNSLSDSSQSSVETASEPLHEKTSGVGYSSNSNPTATNSSNPNNPSNPSNTYHASHQQAVDLLYQPAANHRQLGQFEEDSDDFLNKGRRVVEELGTQFWSLFEDIKNVTIGEEARDTGYDQDYRRRRSSGRHHPSHPQHHPTGNSSAMIVEEEPEVVVTGVSTNVQRRATTSYVGGGLRNSSSMQNLRRASQGGVAEVMNSSSKHLRSVPESVTSSSNSYFVV